jgi:hypothetical protein
MSYNYTLRYKTFDQLLDEAMVDFQTYDLENFIEPQQLIKVAKRVNYDLGLRIFQTKEALLEVEKGFAKLPDNFYVLNFALICDSYTVENIMPQGTHIEERPIIPTYQQAPPPVDFCAPETVNCTKCNPNPCACSACEVVESPCSTATYNPLQPYGDACMKPRVFMDCKDNCYELIQIVQTQKRTYKRLAPVKVINNAQSIDCDCPNLYMNSEYKVWIKDNYIYGNFPTGKLYINYQGMMENDEGELLVPDHDLLNEYYEYALKQRILENLIMNDEVVSQAKIQLIEQRYREARNKALSVVNTPNFSELKQIWELNRKAQYGKYYNMFKSYNYDSFGSGQTFTKRLL